MRLPLRVALLAVFAAAHPAVGAGGCLCGGVADEAVAADLGLVREWVVQVPFDSAAARLEHVVVTDDLVVAQSADGGVHAVRTGAAVAGTPRPGTVLWSQRVAEAPGDAAPAGVGSGVVAVAKGLDVFTFDGGTGRLLNRLPLATAPPAGAVPAGDWLYVPLASGRVMRMPADPRRMVADDADPKAQSRATPIAIEGGGPLASPPVPVAAGVVWGVPGPRLVVLDMIDGTWVRHQIPRELPAGAAGTLVGSPLVRGKEIYVVTTPGGIARVDLDPEGRQGLVAVWRGLLPGRPDAAPLRAGEVLVVSLGVDGLAAYSTQTGDLLWTSPRTGRLVAASADRVWIVDAVGRLAALDVGTGTPVARACLGCFTLPVTNAASDRIVIASPGGLVVSLAPRAAAPRPATDPPRAAPAPAPADPGATPR